MSFVRPWPLRAGDHRHRRARKTLQRPSSPGERRARSGQSAGYGSALTAPVAYVGSLDARLPPQLPQPLHHRPVADPQLLRCQVEVEVAAEHQFSELLPNSGVFLIHLRGTAYTRPHIEEIATGPLLPHPVDRIGGWFAVWNRSPPGMLVGGFRLMTAAGAEC